MKPIHLETQDAQLRLMMETTTDGVWIWDIEPDKVIWNDPLYELLGLKPQEIDTNFETVLSLIHPEDRQKHQEMMHSVLETGNSYELEFRMRCHDGHYIWVLDRGTVFKNEDNRPDRMMGTLTEISDRKYKELWLDGQKQVLEAIAKNAPLSETLTLLIQALESQAPELLGSILLADPQNNCLTLVAAPQLHPNYNQAIDGLPICEGSGSCGTAAYRKEPVIVENIAIDPLWREYKDLALCYGLQAAWSMPIFSLQDQVLGTFCLYARCPSLPTEQYQKLIESATRLAAIAIERCQSEATLRESEQRFRHLFEEVPLIPVQGYDSDLKVFFWNKASEDLYGYKAEEAIGKNLGDLILSPELTNQLRQGCQNWITQGTPMAPGELIARNQNQEAIAVFCSHVLLYNAQAEPEFYCVDLDLTERYQQAEKLSEFSTRLTYLHRLSTGNYHDFEELFSAYLQAGCQLFGLTTGFIANVNQQIICLEFVESNFPQLKPGTCFNLSDQYCSDCSETIYHHKTIGFGHIQEYPQLKQCPPYKNLNLESYLGTPIIVEDKIYGVLSFLSSEVREQPFTEADREMIELMAKDISRFISAHHQELKRQEAESALRERELKYRSIFENISQGIFQSTPDGRYLSANRFLAHLYGYDSPESLIESLTDIDRQLYVDPNRRQHLKKLTQEQGIVYDFESEVYRQDGEVIWISETQRAVVDEEGNVVYYEGTVEDITARRQAEEQLHYDAYHDKLTGLKNRTWFIDHLAQVIHRYQREKTGLYAILFIDLDRFKIINDSLGHLVGDDLLKQVAQRLQTSLSGIHAGPYCNLDRDIPKDTLARFGGDEFAVLLTAMDDPQEAIASAERLVSLMRTPFRMGDYEFSLGASIGITFGHQDYHSPEELLRDADLAMYQAKAQGGGRFVCFEKLMHPRALARLQLEHDLTRALELEELSLCYQPVVCLRTGGLKGFEVLLRWQHSKKGWISPGEFIPVAEEIGLISTLGWWVLEQSCRQLQQWRAEIPQGLNIVLNVNLSLLQLKQVNLVEQIEQLLRSHQIPGDCLNLEITETSFLETSQVDASILHQLKALGVQLSIDDFGTGYSSLSRLHQLPLDQIKIDREFVDGIETDGSKEAIAQTIITLAHNLGAQLVCEGIETPAQCSKLQQLGCEYGQGYLFSRPLIPPSATDLLQHPHFQQAINWSSYGCSVA
ncbi:EAL domain-containing protein [Roseofilum capinflatum]|uniref:EAL domain-containing protein n=1 Tax=Roseofilum capinflatum BLCC-M114 TaxID=3022440 RepID=A0ABT7B3Z3_9CYAN|nr:EAL domain-containing protein [Roseofilum capinflatum]MDJ1173855.1 EAL domain-containing protein [Roseofilum capinflatum BLCC-M114]